MITINALWIGIDTEFNDASNLTEAEWYFQVGEYMFTAFFLTEWLARFGAFRRKRDGLKDTWFCFDSFLVALMMLETFVMPYAIAVPESGGQVASISSSNASDT